jgi:hypothetical protein
MVHLRNADIASLGGEGVSPFGNTTLLRSL